ncbi:ComEA family DNA-binding protein [Desulfoprunum benzoelyticum]|uniref:ComEA family DNA-binding protein n=2 Tax=Desulfoprunum benzoelyticum TaxID=1506996 RepID=UPI00338DA69B
MPATELDRRIVMLLVLAALLHIAVAGRMLWPAKPPKAAADPETVQLRWDGGVLAVCSGRDCRVRSDIDHVEPRLAPFFFQPIPVNDADAKLLETIDGIGPHLASEIIRVREQGVVFRSREDLLQVPGIGHKRVRQLESQFSFAGSQ